MATAMNIRNTQDPTPSGSAIRMTLLVLKWLWRLATAILFLFWGAFFLEHVSEWYSQPSQGLPPWWVGLSMVCHLGMLVGFLLMMRWERLGSLVTLLGTLGFMACVALGQGNAQHLPYIVLINLAPIGLVAVAWLLGTCGEPKRPA